MRLKLPSLHFNSCTDSIVRQTTEDEHLKGSIDRVLYIHAGTHKTATTYIQNFLCENQDTLRRFGLYIPMTGRTSNFSGHHNIAFQLNSDSRYNPSFGSISDLMEELTSINASRVCLSSEDFEFLCMNTAALRYFLTQCTALNYKVKILFLLRPQADYAESLYAELLKWGLCVTFDEFLQSFISQGMYQHGANWWYCSDYNFLLDNFASVFGKKNIIVCPYLNSPQLDKVLLQLLSKIIPEVPFEKSQYKLSTSQENISLSFPDLVRLYFKNKTNKTESITSVLDYESPIDESDVGMYEGKFEPIDLRYLLRFGKFVGPNLSILWKYRVCLPLVSAKILQRELKLVFSDNLSNRLKSHLLKHISKEPFLPPSFDLDFRFAQAANVWKSTELIPNTATTVNCLLKGSAFEAINDDPQIIFPIGSFGQGKNRYLQFDMTFDNRIASDSIGAQVFWTTESEMEFNEKNCCSEYLRSGKTRYTFKIPPEASGFVRLDPINIPGNYLLKYVSLKSD